MISAFLARRGGKLMDRVQPGWAALIDPHELRLRSNLDCILGQIYGSYFDGLRRVGIGAFRGVGYGFMELRPFTTWKGLDKAWQAEIAARMAARRSHVLAA